MLFSSQNDEEGEKVDTDVPYEQEDDPMQVAETARVNLAEQILHLTSNVKLIRDFGVHTIAVPFSTSLSIEEFAALPPSPARVVAISRDGHPLERALTHQTALRDLLELAALWERRGRVDSMHHISQLWDKEVAERTLCLAETILPMFRVTGKIPIL